jgi:dihydrofolate synthase/folylpolyglutamate synthase
MVVGFVNDKSISEILQILPKQAIYYFTQASIPRAKQAKDVYEEAIKLDLRGSYFESTHLALQQAKLDSGKDDLIYIGGSTFVVAELI